MFNSQFFLILPIAYLIGSIPFGLLLTKLAGLGDIRDIGSGNIGATNVLRTGNKKLAALTLLLDYLKGCAAIIMAYNFAPELAPVCGLAALLGHMFPVWLKFKGGKGVATATGIMLALVWPVGVLMMMAWIMTAKVSRYSSLAALVEIGLSPVFVMMFAYKNLLWLTLVMIILIFAKHRANIKRLLNGTEPKIDMKPDAATQA